MHSRFDELDREVATQWTAAADEDADWEDFTRPTVLRGYDAAGRLSYTVDERGYRTDYEHDAAGRQVKVIEPCPELQARGSGGVPLLTCPEARVELMTVHDGNGWVVGTVDGLGREREHVLDAAGRKVEEVNVVAGTSRKWVHDAAGRVVSTTL